jgi:hypothetical protein
MKTCRLRDSDLFEERWLSNGGSATLKSYGVDSAAPLPGKMSLGSASFHYSSMMAAGSSSTLV